jgi:hypothetical protein
MATLEVVGPRDRDTVRPVGDYCEKCWEHILAAMDLIEELLARDVPSDLRPALSRNTHRVNCDGRKRRP